MGANPKLSKPQAQFVNLDCPFPAFIGGYGSGKSVAACCKFYKSAWEFPKVPLGYFAPTFGDIKHTFFPTVEEFAEVWGLRCSIRKGDWEVDLFSGRTYRTTIICRSMKDPATIRGFKIGRGIADEIDTLKAAHAQQAWNKAIARRRFKFDGLGWMGVTTTPEGFRFVWDRWEKQVRADIAIGSPKNLASKYQLIRASTYENEIYLQDDYIENMLSTYTETLAEAYLLGKFRNLAYGTVYREYDRKLNHSNETIQGNEPIFIGMDFNIDNMSGVVHVKRDGIPHAVEEFVGLFDTPTMAQAIKERYWPYVDGDYRKTREIRIYPDASGKSRTRVGAAVSDIVLLKQAGFIVSAPAGNPPVRDRVNSMNAMFCNARGERRYFVNDDKCPTYTENLEQQAYDESGEPDKKSGKDHTNDAGGYFIHRDYPLIRPITKLNIGVAM